MNAHQGGKVADGRVCVVHTAHYTLTVGDPLVIIAVVEGVLRVRVLVHGELAAFGLSPSDKGNEAQHDELAEHIFGFGWSPRQGSAVL